MANNASAAEGQFDDAVEDTSSLNYISQTHDPRAGHNFIDETELLEWSSSSSDEDEPDEFEAEEDYTEAAAFDGLRAEDEDWEIAERGMLVNIGKTLQP
jgi:RIO kinase 1